ncbi:SRPBCC family protein [Capsulimonas corticalis]|uniref:SRPBCC family protein n=1 Tax=Capsulimonas corticalis TaxID=2219043 RepID=UPI002604D7C1|nr:SRPBCC domain-containing protein [Capsulimonas corticalis]
MTDEIGATEHTMEPALSFDAEYPQSPDRVWKALTDPKALARWFLPGDFEPRMGFRFQFEMGRRRVRGEVIDAERERRLSYKWRAEDEPESVVTWTLEPTEVGGTRVHLEHTEAVGAAMSAAWSWGHVVTRALPQVLAAGEGRRGMRLSSHRNRVVLATSAPRVTFLATKGRSNR